MIREADLVSYLPEFMREFKETAAALEAENIADEMIPVNMEVITVFKNMHKFFGRLRHCEMRKYTHKELRDEVLK